MRRRARIRLAAVAATVGVGMTFSAVAVAGFYDYTLPSVPHDTFSSRFELHNYSQLRSRISTGDTTCIARGGGQSFCASTTVSHDYNDGCGPCYSYYKQKSGAALSISAHDEWP